MDYIKFYQDYLPLEKSVKDAAKATQKLVNSISKEMEAGNLKQALADGESLKTVQAQLGEAVTALQNYISQFDNAAYFANGEFATQLCDACRAKGIDVDGSYPLFEMFPYRVKIDAENQDVYLDRKKYSVSSPEAFASLVRSGLDKLSTGGGFNASTFASDLAAAYDVCMLKAKKASSGMLIPLKSIYKAMVPLARSRKDYDSQAFAYDLARLFPLLDSTTAKDGRRIRLGTDRNSTGAIRILDQFGNVQMLESIAFISAN